jgi:hypothetical protein
MKKLLALILCVMLFVSVIPTAAFAATATATDITPVDAAGYASSIAAAKADPTSKATLESAAAYKKQVEKMIENTKKNVATAYGILAMDQVVYSSAKSMDDVVVGLVDQIADQLVGKKFAYVKPDGTTITGKDVDAFKKTEKAALRKIVEDIVIDELKDTSKYIDKDNKIDPVKYGQAFANAVNKALNNKDFQAGYQAVATFFALANVADSIKSQLEDQRDEFKASIDTSFDKDFAKNYDKLAQSYIDTLAEAGGFDKGNLPWAAFDTPAIGAWS